MKEVVVYLHLLHIGVWFDISSHHHTSHSNTHTQTTMRLSTFFVKPKVTETF
jgi:hypothetical protein